LSFQQLMEESAPLRFSIAKRRALSAVSAAYLGSASRLRATAFQAPTGLLCQKMAMWVCSGVRAVLFTDPSALTSLKSSAQAALLRSWGPSVRNWEELMSRNGLTPPTHGVGSSISVPSGFDSGHQCPGARLGSHWEGPKRRSFARAATIASAAALPALIPSVFKGESGMSARAVAYSVPTEINRLSRFGKAIVAGTVVMMLESIR
jgi:hypothetical protein